MKIKEVLEVATLIVAFTSLVVSYSSLKISENVRDMTIPNGYYEVTIYSNRNVTGTSNPIVNEYSVDIQYLGSVPSKYIVIDLSIKSIPGQYRVIEYNPLINHIRDDVIIVYNCPVGINLRTLYQVNGTIYSRSSVKVFDIYSDCPVRVQHDSEKPYVIPSKKFVKPFSAN